MKEIKTKRTFCFRRWNRKGWSVFASMHRPVTLGVLSVSMSILLPATLVAQTQTSDSLTVLRIMQIDEVGVTGNLASPTRSAMTHTPLFDRKSAAAAPFQTLEAALRPVPAIDLRERGGKGVQADISIRGGSFDQTMVMLNGINFTDARTGHQTHALPIDLDCVSGIELIDGVAGVGAYAGAVNIRTMPLRPTYLRLEGAGGEHGYAYGNLSGAVTQGRFTLFAAGSYRRSDGYIHNTDFENWNGFVRMNYDAVRAGFFDIQAGYQHRSFGSNGFYGAYNPDQWEQTETALASARWVKRLGCVTLNGSVSYRKNFDRYDWTRGTPMNHHDTDNVGAEAWADTRWRGGVTSLGGDYTYNHIYSTNLGRELTVPHGRYTHADERSAGNVWLRHVKHWRRFDVSASGGVSFSPYGTSGLWSVSGGWIPARGAHVEAGIVQSLRLPTFTDLYYSSPAQISNPDLEPERAITYRLEGDYAAGRWSASAQLYYRDGRNVIDWVWRPDMGDKWHSEQVGRLGTFGAELTGGYVSDRGALRRATLSYGYVSTGKRGGVITSSVLDYMKHKASAAVEVRFLRNFTLALTGTVYDRYGAYTHYLRDADGTLLRDENGSMLTAQRDFEPYFLLDGRLSWEKGVVRLYVDATNLTGADYFDFGGLRLPGRWFTAGAVFTIGR